MTKKMEEIFNLPESKEIIQQEQEEQKKTNKRQSPRRSKAIEKLANFDKITSALPAVHGLGSMADEELNTIAEKALKAYEDLMDLGMNIEPRFSARMFEVAGNMLKTSLDAKTAKLDKKLKMIELQLKKQKQDQQNNNDDNTINSESYVITDRNSLIERLKNNNENK